MLFLEMLCIKKLKPNLNIQTDSISQFFIVKISIVLIFSYTFKL